jgi:hypothetical protein
VKPPEPGVFQTLSERTPSMVIGSTVGAAAIVRDVRGSAGLSWETALPGTTAEPAPDARREEAGARMSAMRKGTKVRRMLDKRADISVRQAPCQGVTKAAWNLQSIMST